MPPIVAIRSGPNIRRMMNDISTSPTAATKIATACGSAGKNVQAVTASHPKHSKLYKTELCRTWMDCGRCNYGDKCQYAHGEKERRPVSRHPKYKTVYCQPFHKVGYCSYGQRCTFIHNELQPQSVLQTCTNQINRSGNNKINGNSSSSSSCNGDSNGTQPAITAVTTAVTTATTSTDTTILTFGTGEPYCSSAGDSTDPSSAASSSDSSIGSVSPSLDFHENADSVATTNGWNTFGAILNSASFTVYHLNWPTVKAPAITKATVKATIARATPIVTQPILDSTLFSDLLGLTIDEKRKNKTLTKTVSESAVTTVSSGRLPVFTQLSNPS